MYSLTIVGDLKIVVKLVSVARVIWRSEDNFWEPPLFFHPVDLGIEDSNEHLYTISLGPCLVFDT